MANGDDTDGRIKERIDEIRQVVDEFESITGRKACDSTVVEIGFGARPERAFALSAFFKTVYAIDLDAPVLSAADLPRVFRKNGLERGIKSMARHMLFDGRAWPRFHRGMKARVPAYDPAATRLVVGDACDEQTWQGLPHPDLVLSIDVFEHIPPFDLKRLMAQLHHQLAEGGIIITQPMVFTGISGGHDLEWYPQSVATNPSETAWGHLLDPDFRTNTYVNKMTRRAMRATFEDAGFEVTRDDAAEPDFGRHHLTPERRAALAQWDDYELFSNNVTFHLRRAH